MGLTVAACEQPGVRGEGTATVVLAGDVVTEWTGTCRYSVQTRWATALPHILRLEDDSSQASLVISGRKAWSAGRMDLSEGVGRPILGIAMQGSTVEGRILGSVEISLAGDSTFAEARGRIAGRDTVPLEAWCRLGPTIGREE